MSIDRRTLLHGAGAGLVLTLLPASALRAADDNGWQALRDQVLAGRTPLTEGITLDTPAMADNGAQVPLTIRIDSPMSAEDHITTITLIAPGNPTPQMGRFTLTPALSRAELFTRIRLGEAQEILVLAETSDGRVLQQAAHIDVSAGACAT